MKYCLSLHLILAIFCTHIVSAQDESYMELGFTVGQSYYIGDLNPYEHFGNNSNVGVGIIFRGNINPRQVLRIHGLWTRLQADDAENSDPLLINRNLHFQSDIIEAAALLEINFYEYVVGDRQRSISPYFFGGLAYIHMNPKAEYQGTLFELQPLNTEGQGGALRPTPYSLNQLAIPFGIGLKANLGGRAAINIEWGPRKLFTDYLDDVSTDYANPNLIREQNGIIAVQLADPSIIQTGPNATNEGLARGNPNNNDWYYYGGINLSFRLGPKDLGCWK